MMILSIPFTVLTVNRWKTVSSLKRTEVNMRNFDTSIVNANRPYNEASKLIQFVPEVSQALLNGVWPALQELGDEASVLTLASYNGDVCRAVCEGDGEDLISELFYLIALVFKLLEAYDNDDFFADVTDIHINFPGTSSSFSPIIFAELSGEVIQERLNQIDKFGIQLHLDAASWVVILGEEVGEVCQAFQEKCSGYRGELVQVAAVALAMLESIEYSGYTQP